MNSQWCTAKLGELVAFKTGKLDSNAAVPNGSYPFFTCSQETLRTNTFAFDTECVLLAGNNANGIYPLKYFHGKFDAYQRTYVVTTRDPNRLITKFLYYTLRPKLSEFRNISTGATTKFLTLAILNDTAIQVPPLPIQRRIAGILSAYDDLIENSLRRIRILEEMARSLYREWFVYFRFPGNETVPRIESSLGPIPEGWTVLTIQHFGQVVTGKTPSKANPAFYGEDVPFVKTPDMHGNLFVFETNERLSLVGANSQANKTIPSGSICVSCIGTIGIVSITTEKCQTNQQINSLILSNEASREFLFLRLQDAKQTLENLGSTGATMGNVNKGKFEAMRVATPHNELLARYHELVAPMFSQIANLSRQIRNLRQTRDLLLPRLLSGTIDVSDADFSNSSERDKKSTVVAITATQTLSTAVPVSAGEFPSSAKELSPTAGANADGLVPPRAEDKSDAHDEQPPPIDQTDRSDALAAIRQVFSDGKPRAREDAIREVARALGYGHTGHRIQDVLHTDLLTAVRRGILDNVEDELILLARSIAGYDRDFLKQQFLAALGRSWVERNDAIQNFCRWMGFRRTGQIIDETARSVINGLLRESRLEADGPNLIRRTS